jgi:hypothetical protein
MKLSRHAGVRDAFRPFALARDGFAAGVDSPTEITAWPPIAPRGRDAAIALARR